MDDVDCVVVGAGVVGLALARALALAGREVIVLEAENTFGSVTSARNSEVIHAGIYYAPGSLKARLCVRGRQMLYDYCAHHAVAQRRCGKLIVATAPDELPMLEQLRAQAGANGVHDLEPLTAAQAVALEPALHCVGALLSPSTGIVDSHGLMLALLGEAEANDALLVPRSPVLGGRITPQGIELDVGAGTAGKAATPPISPVTTLRARTVVNSAGLGAPALALALRGLPARCVPRAYLAKGCYFTLAGKAPFSRLVYPAPGGAGRAGHLGVHLTLDLGGQARFGPSFRWVDAIDYTVDAAEADAFYAEVRRYWPGLAEGALQPGYAGVRPRISGPDEPAADFRIDGPAVHGVPGLVNLFGIESPGLTASLAIAECVADALVAPAFSAATGAPGRAACR